MNDVSLDELSLPDAYFIAGYIGRSIAKANRCPSCKSLLISDADRETEMDFDVKHVFEMANRGGLSSPSEFCYAATAFPVHHYNHIITNERLKIRFLISSNSRSLFMNVLMTLAKKYDTTFFVNCKDGHASFRRILEASFNCFAKNELKRLNISHGNRQETEARKLRKLSSKSTTSLWCQDNFDKPTFHFYMCYFSCYRTIHF